MKLILPFLLIRVPECMCSMSLMKHGSLLGSNRLTLPSWSQPSRDRSSEMIVEH